MDRGAWWATAPGATKSQTQLKWLSMRVACIQLLFIEGKNYPFSTDLKTNLLYMKSHVVLFLDSLFCSAGLFVYPCNNTTLTSIQQLCQSLNLWRLFPQTYHSSRVCQGLPWCLSHKESACHCRRHRLITDPEDPTGRGAIKPVCHNYWACASQLLSPCNLQPMLRNKRSHCNEVPSHCN